MATTDRKTATAYIIQAVSDITNGDEDNVRIITDYMTSMTDPQFGAFMARLESGDETISIFAPNFKPGIMNVKRNLRLGPKYGHEFFERLLIEGEDDQPSFMTPLKYPIFLLPWRRASQLLTKKLSVPDHSKVVDSFTGQPTGESKGARVSYPEVQLGMAMKLENTMLELMKYRGGDTDGLNAFNRVMLKTGRVNLQTLAPYAGGVESTKTLSTILTAMLLKNNLKQTRAVA